MFDYYKTGGAEPVLYYWKRLDKYNCSQIKEACHAK
jgi:hypothetical protein